MSSRAGIREHLAGESGGDAGIRHQPGFVGRAGGTLPMSHRPIPPHVDGQLALLVEVAGDICLLRETEAEEGRLTEDQRRRLEELVMLRNRLVAITGIQRAARST